MTPPQAAARDPVSKVSDAQLLYILDKNTAKEGEITGMYLIDEEGTLETRDVNARFVNGKPEAIESIYIMKSPEAWDRFMRFMERYGETNGLVFTKAT